MDDDLEQGLVETTMSELILIFVFTCFFAGAGALALVNHKPAMVVTFPEFSKIPFDFGETDLTKDHKDILDITVVPRIREKIDEVKRSHQNLRPHLFLIGSADVCPIESPVQEMPDTSKYCSRDMYMDLYFHGPRHLNDPLSKPDNWKRLRAKCMDPAYPKVSNLHLAQYRANEIRGHLFDSGKLWDVEVSILSRGGWHDKDFLRGEKDNDGVFENIDELCDKKYQSRGISEQRRVELFLVWQENNTRPNDQLDPEKIVATGTY